MTMKKKFDAFDSRFGITEKRDPKEEFQKFKKGVLNIFKDIDSHVDEDQISRFCSLFGRLVGSYNGSVVFDRNIYRAMNEEEDPLQFFRIIEIVLSLPIKKGIKDGHATYSKDLLIRDLKEVIDIFNVDLSIAKVGDEVILRPRGEETLDNKLVDEVFSFLNPISQGHFLNAVKLYEQKKYIQSAESIRRSIEEFLRFKLNDDSGLSKGMDKLLSRLKERKVAKEISNIVRTILDYLDKYFNENSKHNDGDIGEPENEFLLYQVGLLMRYVDKVIR